MSTSFSRVQIRARTNKDALYGITRGTASANKAVVLDANKNITGLVLGGVAPVATGSTKTAVAGNIYLLDTATGSVLTLPAATGTGGQIEVITKTTVTSNSHKILAASTSDFIQGIVFTEDGGTTTGWYSDGTADHSLAMNGTTTGGFIGDNFVLTDIATNMWQVTGSTKSTGIAATPFSTSAT